MITISYEVFRQSLLLVAVITCSGPGMTSGSTIALEIHAPVLQAVTEQDIPVDAGV